MAGTNMVSRSISIYVQSGEAEKAYDRLVKKEQQLKTELEKATDPKVVARLNGELKKLEEPMDRAKKKISGDLSPSLKELAQTLNKLNNELKNMSKEDPGYAKKRAQLHQLTQEYQEQKKAMQGLQQQQQSFFSSVANGFKSLLEGFGIGAGVASFQAIGGALSGFLNSSLEEIDQAEQASSRLKNILDNFGRTDVFERLIKKADEFADKFKSLDNDDIINVFTKLTTYGKLSERQMTDLTPVIIDFAAKQKISLEESSDAIIKALEGNAKALKTYGINIKDGQNVTERFGIVMTDLKQKVNGAQEAFEGTRAGGIAKFKQFIRDVEEGFGRLITKIFETEKSADQLFDDAKLQADSYNNSLKPLLNRYDELKSKATLNKNEQAELQAIIKKIVEIVPQAATEFDKYGNALDINKQKITDFLKEQDKFIQTKSKSAIDELLKEAQTTANAIEHLTNIRPKIENATRNLTGKSIPELLARNSEAIAQNQDKLIQLADTLSEKYKTQLPASIQAFVDAAKKVKFGETLIKQPETDKPIDPNADPNVNKEKLDQLLNEVEQFNKKLRDLQQQSEDASKTKNEKEIADARYKYDEIFIEFQKLQKKIADSGLHLALSEKDIKDLEDNEIAGIIARQQKEIQDKNAKDFIASAEGEYQEAIRLTAAYYEEKKQLEAQRFVAGEIDQKEYLSRIAAIEVVAQQAQLANAQNYANQKISIDGKEVAVVKQADEDLTRFKKSNLEKQTADMIAEFAKREQLQKLLYDLERQTELNHAQARVTLAKQGSEEQYNAQKDLLQLQHDQQVQELKKQRDEDLKAAGENAEAKKQINDLLNQQIGDADALFRQSQEELDKQHAINRINNVINVAQQALQIFQTMSDTQAQTEAAELKRSQDITDRKKKNLENLYNKGTLSRQEYDRKIAELDKQQDDRNKAISLKQFKRQQAIAITSALISGAQAVTSTLAALPGPIDILSLGTLRTIQIGLALATTAAQVVAISKQKPPQLADGGTFLEGPSHDQGGMPIINPRTGRKVAEIEGGEVVLSKRTVANNRSLVSSLLHNSLYRNGSSLEPIWKTRPVQYINYSGIQESLNKMRYFATGGAIGPAPAQQAAADQQNTDFMMAVLQDLAITVSGLKQSLDSGIRASVPLSEIQDQAARKEAIQKSARGR